MGGEKTQVTHYAFRDPKALFEGRACQGPTRCGGSGGGGAGKYINRVHVILKD